MRANTTLICSICPLADGFPGLDHLEEYWAHAAQYPNHVILDEESGYEAHDALMYCYSDRALFKRSNATWSLDDTKELLAIYDRLCSAFEFCLHI